VTKYDFEIAKRHGSISPEFALLGFLYEHPSHGYDLHQRLVSELGFVWHISQSQTYNIINRLVSSEDISLTIRTQKKLPSRQVLRITPKGQNRFKKWLDLPTGSSIRAIRMEFITRLYFSQRNTPEKVQSLLDTQSAGIIETITNLERCLVDLPNGQTYNRLSLQLRIQQLQSALKWVNVCRKELL